MPPTPEKFADLRHEPASRAWVCGVLSGIVAALLTFVAYAYFDGLVVTIDAEQRWGGVIVAGFFAATFIAVSVGCLWPYDWARAASCLTNMQSAWLRGDATRLDKLARKCVRLAAGSRYYDHRVFDEMFVFLRTEEQVREAFDALAGVVRDPSNYPSPDPRTSSFACGPVDANLNRYLSLIALSRRHEGLADQRALVLEFRAKASQLYQGMLRDAQEIDNHPQWHTRLVSHGAVQSDATVIQDGWQGPMVRPKYGIGRTSGTTYYTRESTGLREHAQAIRQNAAKFAANYLQDDLP